MRTHVRKHIRRISSGKTDVRQHFRKLSGDQRGIAAARIDRINNSGNLVMATRDEKANTEYGLRYAQLSTTEKKDVDEKLASMAKVKIVKSSYGWRGDLKRAYENDDNDLESATLEKLEDKYHIDLSELYGEEPDKSLFIKIQNRINKAEGIKKYGTKEQFIERTHKNIQKQFSDIAENENERRKNV